MILSFVFWIAEHTDSRTHPFTYLFSLATQGDMPRGAQAKHLYTASQVARFCQVDLKTIHNWADRDEIPHFRTPGRHLRFQRADVLDFLRKYGYPIPVELSYHKPRVLLLLADASLQYGVASALQPSFEVQTFSEPLAAFLDIGARAPDAIVLEEELRGLSAAKIIAALKQNEQTRHIRAVLFTNGDRNKNTAADAGASAHIQSHNVDGLRDTLEAMMGVQR